MGGHDPKEPRGSEARPDPDARRLAWLRWFGAVVGLAVVAAVLVLITVD